MKANAAFGSLIILRRHSVILSCHSLHLSGELNDNLPEFENFCDIKVSYDKFLREKFS